MKRKLDFVEHNGHLNPENTTYESHSLRMRHTERLYLVLFVLPGVREAGDDGGDAGRGGDLAGVDHDQQLHEVVVDFAAAALDDVDVLAAHALPDFHAVPTTNGERMSPEEHRWCCNADKYLIM